MAAAPARSKVLMADQEKAETDSKWYKGLEKVHSYFVQPFREHWDRKIEFILSCVGYCIGFGNIWRYPYVVYENGGSAFFVPFIIVTFTLSLPLFYMESILGQFSGCNSISAFNFAPACKGIGIGMTFVIFYIILYYIVFLAYTTKYLFASFSFELPWGSCSADWGADENCYHHDDIKELGLTNLPSCKSFIKKKANFTSGVDCLDFEWPAEQYWHKVILKDEGGTLENVGEIHWDIFLLLLLSWVIQYINQIRGIRTSGKVVYFTATFPFLVLVIMLIYALTLDGAVDGLKFLFHVEDWGKVFQASVWRAAITQSFYSTGVAFGCIIVYSSYNEFSYSVQRSVIVIVFLDFLASVLSAMTVFSILGYLANEVDRDIAKVVTQGPGLIFITMPQAIAGMPISHLWSVLYFLMLYTVGIDSEAVMVDSFVTVVYEEIPKLRTHKEKVRIVCIICLFLLSIGSATRGGMHVIQFLETFSAENTLLFLAFCETVALMYIYGVRNFNNDFLFMIGKNINIYWKLCWLIIIPIMLIVLLFLGFSTTTACVNRSTGFCIFGWIIVATCILPVPIVAIVMFIVYRVKKKSWSAALKPNSSWGPREPLYKIGYLDWTVKKDVPEEKMGEQTKQTMAELEEEISDETPDVQAVATKRVKEKRFSVFHRFSKIFHPGELEHLESGSAIEKKP